MDFKEREIDFREADRRYAELKRRLDEGDISAEEFDVQRQQLMVRDDEDRWWAKSRETGEWSYYDGSAWVRGVPPGYQPPPPPLEESAPEPQPRLQQNGSLLSPGRAFANDAPVQNGLEQLRKLPPWIVAAAGLVVVAALAGVVWIATAAFDEAPPSEEATPERASGPAPGYTLVRHDSGAFSVEIPDDWDERFVADSEGEKGRFAWSSFLGGGESAGASMTVVNDLESWRTGTPGHQGIYMVASKRLAQGYTEDELVTSGPNDYSSCEAGAPQDFDRPPYSGKVLQWSNCGGDSDHAATTLAATPEGRECAFVFQIGGLPRVDEESVQHILDTFEADCNKID